jgi:hypothetical protein
VCNHRRTIVTASNVTLVIFYFPPPVTSPLPFVVMFFFPFRDYNVESLWAPIDVIHYIHRADHRNLIFLWGRYTHWFAFSFQGIRTYVLLLLCCLYVVKNAHQICLTTILLKISLCSCYQLVFANFNSTNYLKKSKVYILIEK